MGHSPCGGHKDGPGKLSECPYGAYDPAAKGSLPAAIGELAEPGQLPVAVLRVVREDPPRGVAGRSAWQVQDKVVVLGHCLLFCASGRAAQAIPDNRDRRPGTVAGNSLDRFSGCSGNGLRGRDGHFVAAPRMVLAAVSPERGDKPPCATAMARM